MILSSTDLIDWIADRHALLVAAWTPHFQDILGGDRVVAEALSIELHNTMVTTLLRKGTEKEFVAAVRRSNTGLPDRIEKTIADRFYDVTLRLARAASRHIRDDAATFMPFKYGVVVGDGRTDPSHLPLAQVLLPRNHPFWTKWQPPFGMECRCSTNLMTQHRFERSGRTVTSDDDLAWIESQLRDCWPDAFRPLLDFRKPLEPVVELEPGIRLTAEQLAEILAGFE